MIVGIAGKKLRAHAALGKRLWCLRSDDHTSTPASPFLAYKPHEGFMNILEVPVGLEPTKIGFADRRLDRFGIATLYPNLYPKLNPSRPRIAYLPHTISLQVVDFACDRANEMILQTIALPLGDRATALR